MAKRKSWAVRHKSGRLLFITHSKRTAMNRLSMGWNVTRQ